MLLFFWLQVSKIRIQKGVFCQSTIPKMKNGEKAGLGWSINKKILDNEKRLNPRFVRQDNLKKGA